MGIAKECSKLAEATSNWSVFIMKLGLNDPIFKEMNKFRLILLFVMC